MAPPSWSPTPNVHPRRRPTILPTMAPTPTTTVSSIAALSTSELMDEAAATSRRLAALAGRIVLLAAELDRREAWREEGATSVENWLADRYAVSPRHGTGLGPRGHPPLRSPPVG